MPPTRFFRIPGRPSRPRSQTGRAATRLYHPRLTSIFAFTLVLAFAVAKPDESAASRFGLYTDESGSTCSFSGNTPGIVTAYLVVKADPEGVLGVRFSAPTPSCLDGTFLYQNPGENVTAIGSLPTGVSLSFQSCVISDAPAVALEVAYFTNGGTAPCCALPIVADPFVGAIEVTNCSFGVGTATPITSHFNADATCACVDGIPPQDPVSPTPAHHATNVSMRPLLGWVPYSQDQVHSYDVYLGPNPSPPIMASVTSPSFQSPLLNEQTEYYWRVVVRNTEGLETSGPTWRFTTRSNEPPSEPEHLSPLDGAQNLYPDVTIQWNDVTDPDGDAVTYDLYFAANLGTPALYATGLLASEFTFPTLAYETTYRWRVVARDEWGAVTPSHDPWSFRIRSPGTSNLAPSVPTPVSPVDFALKVFPDVTLQWTSTDPDGDALTYDLYFGPTLNPPLLVAGLTVDEYSLPTLSPNTTYRWKIVVHDTAGHTVSSGTSSWRFTTKLENEPPSILQSNYPGNFTATSPIVTLQWSVTDLEGDALTYDLYFGTAGDPPLLVAGLAAPEYALPTLPVNTIHFWKIVTHDSFGNTTPNYILRFTTSASIPPAPPSSPSPAHLATEVSTDVTLSWEFSDPDGDPVVFDLYVVGPGYTGFVLGNNLTTPTFTLTELPLNTDYSWRVVAIDNHGVETMGSLWAFRTRSNPGPVLASWSPEDAANDVPAGVTLLWQATDEDSEPLTYDVYFGAAEDPSLVASNLTSPFYTPGELETGTTYYWRILPHDPTGPGTSSAVLSFTTTQTTTGVGEIPTEVVLGRNHPNPFNPQTTIPYVVPPGSAPVRVRLAIYDTAGRLVRLLVDEEQTGGARDVVWRGEDSAGKTVTSGVYFCVLSAGDQRRTQKLVMLK